jgi:hypothetical protein
MRESQSERANRVRANEREGQQSQRQRGAREAVRERQQSQRQRERGGEGGITSGITRGTAESRRNADELSITTAPPCHISISIEISFETQRQRDAKSKERGETDRDSETQTEKEKNRERDTERERERRTHTHTDKDRESTADSHEHRKHEQSTSAEIDGPCSVAKLPETASNTTSHSRAASTENSSTVIPAITIPTERAEANNLYVINCCSRIPQQRDRHRDKETQRHRDRENTLNALRQTA